MSKTPLIFLPGLLCDDELWQTQADAIADIATPHIANLTQDDSIAAMAQSVLSNAPDKFALAGLSMGGYVAFEIMRQAPERVTRLALFDTSAAQDDAERIAQREAGISSMKLGKFMGVTNRMLPQLIHESRIDSPVAKQVQDMAARVGGEAFLRQQKAILARIDSRPTLANIKVPTLVAVGDSDVVTPPSHALEIHNGIAGSEYYVFKNCGHLPVLESPDETTKLLREWLLG
jgi:pimeloyl-ACP methyl ester carboxylesterase